MPLVAGRLAMICVSTDGAILHPQPPPCARLVKRIGTSGMWSLLPGGGRDRPLNRRFNGVPPRFSPRLAWNRSVPPFGAHAGGVRGVASASPGSESPITIFTAGWKRTRLARISHRGRCIGPRNLRSSFCDKGLIDSGAGSDADRVSGQLEFEGFDGRHVVAAFAGGAVTSDAGALLLRET